MFYFKFAARNLARNISVASHPAALFVVGGSFLPDGTVWNAILGAVLWLVMQGTAFFLRAWSDGIPPMPPAPPPP